MIKKYSTNKEVRIWEAIGRRNDEKLFVKTQLSFSIFKNKKQTNYQQKKKYFSLNILFDRVEKETHCYFCFNAFVKLGENVCLFYQSLQHILHNSIENQCWTKEILALISEEKIYFDCTYNTDDDDDEITSFFELPLEMESYSIGQSENLFDNLSDDDKKNVKVSNVHRKWKNSSFKTSKPKKKIQNILKRK